VLSAEESKTLLQSFTKFVANKNDYERALNDGEVGEDEIPLEPSF
jgi:hypothetical protein